MNPMESARGRAVVVQPGEGRSWWQPAPANGHAEPKLVPADTGFGTLSMGFQTIAPGSRIRPHSHGDQVELQNLLPGSRIRGCGRGAPSPRPGDRLLPRPGREARDRERERRRGPRHDVAHLAGRPRGLLPHDRPRAHPRRARPSSVRAPGGRGRHRARDRHERHHRHRPLTPPGPPGPARRFGGPAGNGVGVFYRPSPDSRDFPRARVSEMGGERTRGAIPFRPPNGRLSRK